MTWRGKRTTLNTTYMWTCRSWQATQIFQISTSSPLWISYSPLLRSWMLSHDKSNIEAVCTSTALHSYAYPLKPGFLKMILSVWLEAPIITYSMSQYAVLSRALDNECPDSCISYSDTGLSMVTLPYCLSVRYSYDEFFKPYLWTPGPCQRDRLMRSVAIITCYSLELWIWNILRCQGAQS